MNRSKAPLQVYLDSSDFSNLSNVALHSEYGSVKEALQAAKRRGDIEIRYSYAHVVEAAPTSLEHLPHALDRFRCITELCGLQCLVDPFQVLKLDDDHGNRAMVQNDDGDWCPSFSGSIELPNLSSSMKEEIALLPRALRRKQQRQMFDRAGVLRAETQKSLQSQAGTILSSTQDDYPLDREALVTLEKYVLGVGNKSEAAQALRRSISDLENFARWHAKQWKTTSKLSAWLRDSGENLRSTLAQAGNDVAQLYESGLNQGLSKERMNAVVQDAWSRNSNKTFFRMFEALGGSELPLEASNVQRWQRSPALGVICSVALQIFRLTAFSPKQKRRPLTSDIGDLFHCTYLPWVDIFRADSFVSQAISNARMPIKTSVVSKLRDLPKVIEQRLAAS